MKNTTFNLNKTDIKILEILQKNGRLPVVELAKKINLTTTPCSERLKRLEKAGYIEGYKANLNPEVMGLEMCIFIHIRLDQSNTAIFELFTEAVREIEEIEESYLLTGSFDAMIKVRVASIKSYRQFMSTKLTKLPGIIQSQSQVVTEEIKPNLGPNPNLIEIN